MTAFAARTSGWFTTDDCRLDDFRAVVETTTELADYPYADEVRENVLVYGARLRSHSSTPEGRREVQAELARALADGPGIVVFAGAFPDPGVVDRATAVFEAMIAEQKAAGVAGGDHFAPPGANDRVWGALDKFPRRDPEAFAAYYGNDVIALVSEAWLGRGYQVTSQVNVVNPGGQAQVAHRDYHLGFMSEGQGLAYPAHAHRLSPVMTLQGAVAHCDMPVVTGPTLYLPHSQNGEGSIFKRANGRWYSALTYRDDFGEVKRQEVSGRTQAEVRAKLRELRERVGAGAPVKDASITMAAWLEDWTTKALPASDRKQATIDLYATIARSHLVPKLGSLPLDRLRPSDVEALVLAKRRAGLSASSVRTIYTVLRAALDVAVRDGLIQRNPAALVKRPAVERKDAGYLSPQQAEALLEAIRGDRLEALYRLMLATGLRRGEALALHWRDVDLDAAVLQVW